MDEPTFDCAVIGAGPAGERPEENPRMQPVPGSSRHTGGQGDAPHCHVPASFDPKHRRALVAEVSRLVKAAQWLARELEEERGCHAALLQVSVLQADLDTTAGRLVDGHLRYCVREAVAAGQGPDEIGALLTPLQSLLYARRA